MDISVLYEKFNEIYGGGGDIKRFFSPGRVNLIGEHTDYNGGYVFPCAISFGTNGLFRKCDDKIMKFASVNNNVYVEITTDDIVYEPDHSWVNYLKGVIREFISLGHAIGGFELLISGDIPNGAGLSSSASIELLMSAMLNEIYGCGMTMLDMVKLSQRAENTFVGVNCGIMDQFAVGMGKNGYAMFLNCGTLDFEYVPFDLDKYGLKLIIANTNYIRKLSDSKYNERRSQCEKAVEYLQREMDITCLGELSAEAFEANKHLIEDEVIRNRAAHVVYEDLRAVQAVERLKAGDMAAFGALMNQSHASLRDLYEVTGQELDIMAEEAWRIDGVLGSRMTGAGFGGCTVSIVREDAVERFITEVGDKYRIRTGLDAAFYIGGTGNGAGIVE